MCISNILPQRKWDKLQILSQFLGLRTCQLIWLLTLEPSDLKHFNPQNIEMFSLHTTVRSVFVILVLNGRVSFKSSTVHAIPRIHTLLWEKSHRCRGFFFFLHLTRSPPNVFTQWAMNQLSWLLLHFTHILQMSFKLAHVQSFLRFSPPPRLRVLPSPSDSLLLLTELET